MILCCDGIRAYTVSVTRFIVFMTPPSNVVMGSEAPNYRSVYRSIVPSFHHSIAPSDPDNGVSGDGPCPLLPLLFRSRPWVSEEHGVFAKFTAVPFTLLPLQGGASEKKNGAATRASASSQTPTPFLY